MKVIAICGSPRRGNTEFILNKIFNSLPGKKELILLRNKNIKHCSGCLSCDKTKKCVIKDDMEEIYNKLKEADLIIIGTPNYFDNVTGLLKDFIDRTNPLYMTDILKGKKLINIVVGGGKIKNSQRVVNQALTYFAKAHNLKIINSYFFQALNLKEVESNPKTVKKIGTIIRDIQKLKCKS